MSINLCVPFVENDANQGLQQKLWKVGPKMMKGFALKVFGFFTTRVVNTPKVVGVCLNRQSSAVFKKIYFFNRLLSACCEMPSMRDAMDWFPLARFMASAISHRVASFMVGKSPVIASG